jgi:uncharacterized membrane protein
VFISLSLIGSVATHIALLLASYAYASWLAQDHIYRAYHPHNTIFTVIGGEVLVGIAFGVECIVAADWIRAEPTVAAGLFITLHVAAMIPIWRWQRRQAAVEKARERAVEARLAAEERGVYGD